MSIEFTKDNLYSYLKELGKVFRKLNGKKMPAEIVLIGGGAVLANYNFREMTTDIDAIIRASSAMKDAILAVSDKFGLPPDWLSTDFKHTDSYSNRLEEVSIYYRTFSNVLVVRAVAAEYLIAMKLMSGRRYKNDLSDIVGILWEHEKSGNPITKESAEKAFDKLYGQASMPDISRQLLDDAFSKGNYEQTYMEVRENERDSKNLLLEFDIEHPGKLKGENINDIIEMMRQRKCEDR